MNMLSQPTRGRRRGLVGDAGETAAATSTAAACPCGFSAGSTAVHLSTMNWPMGSSFDGGPPGMRTISRTGLPLTSAMRPPTWSEPMPRSTMSSSAANAGAAAKPATIATRAIATGHHACFPPDGSGVRRDCRASRWRALWRRDARQDRWKRRWAGARERPARRDACRRLPARRKRTSGVIRRMPGVMIGGGHANSADGDRDRCGDIPRRCGEPSLRRPLVRACALG